MSTIKDGIIGYYLWYYILQYGAIQLIMKQIVNRDFHYNFVWMKM